MEERNESFNLVESISFAVLVPMIPAAITGLAWLGTLGSFNYIDFMRSIPMTMIVGALAILSVIAALANYEEV
tara:strand:+ start:229 stop:447 length:219 start_codon:yes stop_codon:yes gene_type:complete